MMAVAPHYITSEPLKYFTQDQIELLDPARIPQHIAIIMDGNRRWAKEQQKRISEGHRKGADTSMDILRAAKELGIRWTTLFVFSTENWNRPPEEVAGILWLLETYIREKIPEMVQQRIRFHTIGDISKFPKTVQSVISDAKAATEHCQSLNLIFAMNYGARDEMKRAIQKMIHDQLTEQEITEKVVASYLDTATIPDPDLLIRTSGEMRISNFLLWQLSYTEIYVTETLWPDFTPSLLLEAVLEYQNRERRTGI
jgi:undecaprenyl diphosphate synthase